MYIIYTLYIQYLLKITGCFLARVIDFLVFFVKCKTVKCNFRVFLSKKYIVNEGKKMHFLLNFTLNKISANNESLILFCL